ncbi:hypothetical protein ACG04R_00965 [Roseateles sp. BYS78W]|uniref:Uncharacterized protein n=1 Tax=Pelomonas candidula TaxID=3299025 RepID=A0ABW7H5U8_9BURK
MDPQISEFLTAFVEGAMWRLLLAGALMGAWLWAFAGPTLLRGAYWLLSYVFRPVFRYARARDQSQCSHCDGTGIDWAVLRARHRAKREGRERKQ